ncbi:unnamed protein product [Lactuca saligna]|uniref:Uncharacterized protein n=1 Tax=Lactuca saligna TaxID=75948 RepID=A0AA36ENB3_LACSI|nr:unnamed protein product [Lactuca saligna]
MSLPTLANSLILNYYTLGIPCEIHRDPIAELHTKSKKNEQSINPPLIINYSNVPDLQLKSDSNQNDPHMCHDVVKSLGATFLFIMGSVFIRGERNMTLGGAEDRSPHKSRWRRDIFAYPAANGRSGEGIFISGACLSAVEPSSSPNPNAKLKTPPGHHHCWIPHLIFKLVSKSRIDPLGLI